ncbi:MAG: glutathione ABC transporter substrate-binding protein [Clostridia bacterium]|nr:glutathione ABC transporter substrate-binding protein [Clostridia bacterium]
MKKSNICLLLAIIFIISALAGCTNNEVANTASTSGSDEDEPMGNIRRDIVIGVSSDVVSPDPHDQNDTNSNRVIRMMFDSLVYCDTDGTIKPALAESWEAVSDTEYRFKLREGVKFHNGYDFTAEDVVFSLERQMESPKVKTFVSAIESVTADDDYTVTVRTKQPFAPLLYNLSLTQSSIICSKHFDELTAAGKKYAEMPVGTGAMVFDSWLPNDNFTVKAFDGYWGEKPEATKISVRVIPESSSRTIALETGEIDVVESVPAIDIPRVMDNSGLKTYRQTSTSVTYASFNTRKAPFDNVKVRQALSCAVDKEAIIDVICEGYALQMNTIYPPAMPSYDENLNLYPYDIERAKKLLVEAGYPNGFEIEIATSGDERNRIAQLLQSDFAKIGVNVKISLLEWGAYLDYIGGTDHQMYIVGWSSGMEPDGSTTPLFHSDSVGPTGNRSWYQNADLDALIEQGKSTLDMDERIEIYKEIQRITMEDAVWIPLFAKETVIAMNKNLEGMIISPTDSHIYVYSYVKE